MFARSLTRLAGAKPPFATFYKSISGSLSKTAAPQRMKVASALWRRTSPKYGILYSAPRVADAKRIYIKEGNSLVKGPAKAKKASSRKAARSTKKARKVPAKKSTKKAAKKVTPYASFVSKVMKQAKLSATATNRQRVFRMWIMTGQQRNLSLSKRVSMAVRLLNKDKKGQRKLSKKVAKKAARKPKRTSKSRKATKAKGAKKRKAAASKKKKPSKARKVRMAAKKKSKARKTARKLASKKAKARKVSARKAKPTRKAKGKAARKPRRAAAKKTKSGVSRHGENPYIEFYRRVRMTGLLPNGPKVVGSRAIKKLWARTHSIPSLDARVAKATKMLEAQTGAKAMPDLAAGTAPPAKAVKIPKARKALKARKAAKPAAAPKVDLKKIEIPSYYNADPFSATYAALLPISKSIPESTRMAHVAKAWSATEMRNDTRDPKQRVAAVAQELISKVGGNTH